MRCNFSVVFLFITMSVGLLIVWVDGVTGTEIIILKSAEEASNTGIESSLLEHDNTSTKRVVSSEMGGLCSSAEQPRHRHRRHNHRQCLCRRILCPVCGSDGVSYANLCYLNCQKATHTGLDIAYNGRCKSGTVQSKL